MSNWLGPGLACVFGLVAVRRGRGADVPGSVMAAGMALMSLGMAGIGPAVVHGPWWAAGFAAVAVWPLFRAPGTRAALATRTAHLLGGVAMILMCVLPAMPPVAAVGGTSNAAHVTPAPAVPVPAVPATASQAMAGMDSRGPIDVPTEPTTVSGPLGVAGALLGWALACYFLLGTITALTRRTNGTSNGTRLTKLDEAAMGFGTVVMLTAFT